MVIFFDAGLVFEIIAVIAVLVFLASEYGIDGLCEIMIENPQSVLLICTVIFAVISIMICGIIVVGSEKKCWFKSFSTTLFWSVPLTLSLSASTIFNIYNTAYSVQRLHTETDLALRIIFFIIPIIYIVVLIITYIISYCVGLLPFFIYVFKGGRFTESKELPAKIASLLFSTILYVVISYIVLSGNNEVFMVLTN